MIFILLSLIYSTFLALSTMDSAGTALKQYLDDACFQVEPDAADPGRFYASVFSPEIPTGDLVFMW